MIACRVDLQQDVEALVDALAAQRRALVSVEALRSKLEWDADRFGDAAAEAEDAGRVQSWDGGEDGGDLSLILTPVEAGRRRLVLSSGGVNSMRWVWTKIGSKWNEKAERDRNRVVHGEGVVGASMLNGDIHGLDFMDQLPNGRPSPLLAMVGDEVLNGIAPTDAGHYLPKPRRPRWDDPFAIRDGGESWPLPGTRIADWSIGTIGTVREMVVLADTCPACGSTRETRKIGCLVCEHWPEERKAMEMRRAAYEEADRVRQFEEDPEHGREALLAMASHAEFDPATGRRVIRFQPKAPKRGKAAAR